VSIYDVPAYVAIAITIFLLVSCIYRKHIQRRVVFFWAMGLFIGSLVIIEVAIRLHPDRFRTAGAPLPGSVFFDWLANLGNWIMYASLPVFVLACTGHSRAFAQCSQCGYDLTGNKSGICPECGANLEVENGGMDDDDASGE